MKYALDKMYGFDKSVDEQPMGTLALAAVVGFFLGAILKI